MYTGIKEVLLSDEEVADFYENKIRYEMSKNQYLLVKRKEDGSTIEKRRWDGEKLVKLKWKAIESQLFDKIKPLNDEQECLFDLLDNESIIGKLIVGAWGSGKTMVSLSWSLDKVVRGRFNKLIFIRNNIEVKDTVSLGALPSDSNSKLKPWAMPIADVLGSELELDRYISDGKIELVHLGFARSRSFDNSVIVINECQNLTAEHMALLVSRVGKNTIIIFDGDVRQSDKITFEKNPGINALVNALAGNEMFGMVNLKKTERSKFASLAENICRID